MRRSRIALVNVHYAKGTSSLLLVMFIQARLGAVLIQEPAVIKVEVMRLPNKEARVIWDAISGNTTAFILVRNDITIYVS